MDLRGCEREGLESKSPSHAVPLLATTPGIASNRAAIGALFTSRAGPEKVISTRIRGPRPDFSLSGESGVRFARARTAVEPAGLC